jgi:hypothetical protein
MATIDERPADTRDMAAAHRMFRREFELMPGLVRAVAVADRDRAALVADHVALVCSVLEHHHSGEEEYVWPLLRERCPQQPALTDVDVMEAQHQAIHEHLIRVKKDVAVWIDSASTDTREAAADAIDQLIPVMKEHLALEEERVVPLIDRYVTDAEYARVGQGQAVEVAPEMLSTIFGMFAYETAPEVLDMVITHTPAEIQPVIKDLGTKAYAAYAQQLHGTATPARVDG